VPDITMACNIDADAATVYRAISTSDGVRSWFTSAADIGEGPGAVHRLTFPGIPAPWELRVERAEEASILTLSVVVGPPEWIGTTMTYEIVDRAERGVVVNFDHRNFATVGGVRAWTIGWSEKILSLRRYAETGVPDPCFVVNA
jgi:uncharacterized protein YndB with AHSA1/START domain